MKERVNNMKKLFSLILLLALTFTLTSCEEVICPVCPADNSDQIIAYDGDDEITDATLLELMEMFQNDHYSQPSKQQLLDGMLEGLINSLEDPHTTYFDFEEYSEYQGTFGESYVGIGVTVTYSNGLIIVEEVKSDGPADNAGILPNDIIAFVDFEEITEDSFYDVIGKIVGEAGTNVTVGVIRSGAPAVIHLEMTRAVIENSSVKYELIEEGTEKVGYIEVTTFGDETYNKFIAAVDSLETLGMDSLVIDLRNNGGGHLYTVLYMLKAFLLDNNEEMFSTEYYVDGVFRRDEYFGDQTSLKDYDIVTLVNGNSASASEVFASSMQEHGGYKVMGTLTYGKGTMQTDRYVTSTCDIDTDGDLVCTDADRIHISFGKWLTADMNWVHFNGGTDGITPDIEVEPSIYNLVYKLFLFDGETLEFDQVDYRISNMQKILNMMGYDVREDGYFDLQTETAIKDIQANNSLTNSGIVDSQTLVYINEGLDNYQDDLANDTQLNEAIDYLTGN